MKEKIKNLLKSVIEFILNPRLLLCVGAAWFITNGWSYVMFFIGTVLEIPWMITVSGAYLAFLWLPVSPEKLVTMAIAIALLRFFFPQDKKTLGKLKVMHQKLRTIMKKRSK